MRLPLAALAFAAAAPAQLALFSVDPERLVEGQYQMGSVAAGDVLEARLRLRNVGPAPVPLAALSVAGSGFALANAPALPRTVAAGEAVDFLVRFAPGPPGAYSASLRAGPVSAILLATATAALTVAVEENGAWRTLASGAAVDFGAVERGRPAARRVALSNRTGAALSPTLVSVTPGAFALAESPAEVALPPGESAVIAVVCVPAREGAQEGELAVGTRRFALRATGFEPPLPRPEIVVELAEALNGRQGRVTLRLPEASRTSASGELRLEFEPALGLGPDPAVLFAAGGTSAAFTIEEGDTAARFGARSWAEFQTGSTAGSLVFSVEVRGHRERHAVAIAPAPAVVGRTRALRREASVEVEIAGWDNTRAISGLTFTFFDKAGAAVSPGAIRVDAAAAFRDYFASPPAGGAFLLRAVFPVTGGADRIDAVEADLFNPAGAGRTGTARLSGLP